MRPMRLRYTRAVFADVTVRRDDGHRACAELSRNFVNGRISLRAIPTVLTRPATSLRAFQYIASLPRLMVAPSPSPAGDRIRARLGNPRWGIAIHLAQPVLLIPPSERAYVTGNRRQTVRKNARKATREGYRCRVISVQEAIQEHDLVVDESHIVAIAEAPDGEPRGITFATVDREWALLEGLVKIPGHDTPSAVRYLLHLYLMDRLRMAGARYMLATRVGRERPGLQYFQHILGFVPTNIVLLGRSR